MSDTSPGPVQDSAAPLVLVVDDEDTFRERLARALRARQLEVMTAAGYDQAVELARQQSPELAVVNLRMPEHSGLELIKALKAIDPSTRILVLTGYGSIATAVEAVRLGALQYLSKPADADDILAAFAREPGAASELPTEFEAPSLARVEWEHIQRVLTDCAGNVSEAARRLRIHRRSLQRKLQKPPSPNE